jgi:hypothetical protein
MTDEITQKKERFDCEVAEMWRHPDRSAAASRG